MTRKKRIALQGTREDVKKPLKRSLKQESSRSSKVNPTVQRQSAEKGDAAAILNLQRTIGNRAVGHLLKGVPEAIQRQSYDEDQEPEDDRVANSSLTLNTGIFPAKNSESQSPEDARPSMEPTDTVPHEMSHIVNNPTPVDPDNEALANKVGQVALGETPIEQEE